MKDHILGKTYGILVDKETELKSALKVFDSVLEKEADNKLATAGKNKYEAELRRNLSDRSHYLKMVVPVVESAFNNEDLSEWFYDRFKSEQISLDDALGDDTEV